MRRNETGIGFGNQGGADRAAGRSRRRNGAGLLLAGIVAAFAAFATGCEEADSQGAAVLAPEETGQEAFRELRLSDLPAELALTAEQSRQMEAAIERWNESRAARRDELRERMRERREAMRDRRAEKGHRRGPRRGPGFWGRASDEASGGEAPRIEFLAEASRILTADQFTLFARALADRREEMAEGIHDRRGHGPGFGREGDGGWGGGPGLEMLGRLGPEIARELDLSSEQRARLRETLRSHHEESRELRKALRSGTLDREAARAQFESLREELLREVRAILTAEQWSRLEEMRADRREARVERRIDRLDGSLDRRAEHLARILDLSRSQRAEVERILLGTVPERAALLRELAAGSIEPEDSAARLLEIERRAAVAIRALLTPDQAQRFDALIDLLPRGMGFHVES